MNLQAACDLASEIDSQYDGVAVLAIGRFLPPELITPAAPWKISVQIDGDERPKVIANVSEARTLKQSQADQRERVAAGFLF